MLVIENRTKAEAMAARASVALVRVRSGQSG